MEIIAVCCYGYAMPIPTQQSSKDTNGKVSCPHCEKELVFRWSQARQAETSGLSPQ